MEKVEWRGRIKRKDKNIKHQSVNGEDDCGRKKKKSKPGRQGEQKKGPKMNRKKIRKKGREHKVRRKKKKTH